MLTEEEAKTKWCPMARVVPARLRGGAAVTAGAPSAHNRIDPIGDAEKPVWNGAMRCVASECMAWRWAMKSNPHYPIGAMSTTEKRYVRDGERGYCGLAGEPK